MIEICWRQLGIIGRARQFITNMLNLFQALLQALRSPPCIALSRGVLSTGPGRDHVGKSSCLTGSICFQLLCICMALAGRPPQPCCTCGGFRCTCIDIAVVEDSLAELDLYPPPCLFACWYLQCGTNCFNCLSRSAGHSTTKIENFSSMEPPF